MGKKKPNLAQHRGLSVTVKRIEPTCIDLGDGKNPVSKDKQLRADPKLKDNGIDAAKEFWKGFEENNEKSPSVSQTLGNVDPDDRSESRSLSQHG